MVCKNLSLKSKVCNFILISNWKPLLKQIVFLKLAHTEYEVNHKIQPFWVKVVYLVPNIQILAGHMAKQMVPMASPARIWTLGTRWTTLTQNGWVLWFTWVLRMHQFQKYYLLRRSALRSSQVSRYFFNVFNVPWLHLQFHCYLDIVSFLLHLFIKTGNFMLFNFTLVFEILITQFARWINFWLLGMFF